MTKEEEDNPLGNVKQQLEQSSQQEQEQQKESPEQVEKEQQGEQAEEEGDGPAFPFSEAHQRPLYPREDRWNDWEDAKFEAEGVLRKRGVRDPQGREFDDALLQLGIENPERLAELVLQARGLDVDGEPLGE